MRGPTGHALRSWRAAASTAGGGGGWIEVSPFFHAPERALCSNTLDLADPRMPVFPTALLPLVAAVIAPTAGVTLNGALADTPLRAPAHGAPLRAAALAEI